MSQYRGRLARHDFAHPNSAILLLTVSRCRPGFHIMLNPGSPLFVGRLWQVSCQLKHQAVVTQEDPIVSDADFPGSSMVFQSFSVLSPEADANSDVTPALLSCLRRALVHLKSSRMIS